MKEGNIVILELKEGEVNILNAETDSVKIDKTGLFICKEGEVSLALDGQTYNLVPHSVIVYFSYSTLRILKHTENLRGTLIGANLEAFQPLLYSVTNFDAVFVIRQMPFLHLPVERYRTLCQYVDLLKGIVRPHPVDVTDASAIASAEIVRRQAELVAHAFMLEVLQCYPRVLDNPSSCSRKDEILRKFVALLYREFRTQHDVTYYAEQQFLTTRYFSTIVKERSGKSPSQWIATALLVEARRLLKDSRMSIKEISDYLYFPNQSYFGKWFKHLSSLTPLDFRRGKNVVSKADNDFDQVVEHGIQHEFGIR